MSPLPALPSPESGGVERLRFIESFRSGNSGVAPTSFLPDTPAGGTLESFLTGLGDAFDEVRTDTSARINTALEFAASVRATPPAVKAEAERLAAEFAERDTLRFWLKHGRGRP
jgi:hypothetical protein